MSHEIRSPMCAIIGMSHLALRTDLTTHQRDYIDKIQAYAKQLLEGQILINHANGAVKFAERGQIEIALRVRARRGGDGGRDRSGQHVLVDRLARGGST